MILFIWELLGREIDLLLFLLSIHGLEWDFAEGLSAEAGRSLAEAERLLQDFIEKA